LQQAFACGIGVAPAVHQVDSAVDPDAEQRRQREHVREVERLVQGDAERAQDRCRERERLHECAHDRARGLDRVDRDPGRLRHGLLRLSHEAAAPAT
jgi:hypothetical protein